MKQVVRIQFERLVQSLKKNKIEITISEKAVDYLALLSYDPVFGARPVKRNLQRLVMNDMAKEIIGGKVTNASSITIDVVNDKIIFKNN
jgi:ATP-dependent Clp protease ATP-binding subunit ClpB